MRATLLFLLLSVGTLNAQQLSEQATISIITCGPFQGELYSAFGHSAIRVYDPVNGLDDAYNYGVFDFDQPNFYLNFARGYLYYKLGVYPYPLFRDYYIYHNRYVHEQELNLTASQKQSISDFLVSNALPENQTYRYDYFYNNCATKVRDVFVEVFKDSVVFDGQYITTDYSIRGLTDLYLQHQPWGDLGIDLGLGMPIDKTASPYEYMFLPDYIESGFDHASLNGQPLVKEKIIVYEANKETLPFQFFTPLAVFTVFAICYLIITAFDIRKKRLSRWADFILFSVTGLIGWLLLLLWVATDHQAAAYNFNLLWALPTHAIAAMSLFKNKKWLKKYFLVTTLVCITLLLSWMWLPQQLHVGLIPLVVILLMRSVLNYKMIEANDK